MLPAISSIAEEGIVHRTKKAFEKAFSESNVIVE
jgi:hypothetical protein